MRAAVLQQVSDGMRAQREALGMDTLMGSFSPAFRAATTLKMVMPVDFDVLWKNLDTSRFRTSHQAPARTFVCQGCGASAAVLHGASMRCECGVTGSAELLT